MPHVLLAQAMLQWLIVHHNIIDIGTRTIAVCAFLHTLLPPWDWNPDFVSEGLSEFPELQNLFRRAFNNRYYRILIYVIGYIALHARSTVWQYISVKNVNGPNANAPK